MSIGQVWNRYFWGSRKRHQDTDEIFKSPSDGGFSLVKGVYFIGCGEEIIYIGQSISNLAERSIVSLARVYHKVEDINLPWSIGLSPISNNEVDDLNELESTAIRKYAPIFNTSIPNEFKSEGKEPEITKIARVFAEKGKTCTAFEVDNLNKQMIKAKNNLFPPWKKKK